MVTYNLGPEKVVKITRNALAVLEELAIKYPTLVVLSEASKVQSQEIGDGVKSFIIMTAELLKRADNLISKGVHPTTILKGYEEATKKTMEIIKSISEPFKENDLASVLDSVDCGRGCLTSQLQEMIIQAKNTASPQGHLEKDRVRILRKPGGTQAETELVKGLVVKKSKLHPNMPENVSNPKIALTSGRIGINRLEVKMPGEGPFKMNLEIKTPQNLVDYRSAERKRKADSIAGLEENNVNVLFSQQPIDDYSKSRLTRMGVLAFASVDRADIALISKATGAKPVSNLSDLEKTDVGSAEKLETDRIALEEIVVLNGCPFVTFLLRGSNPQVLDEQELLILNSLRLLQLAESSPKKVPGGGATELQIAKKLKDFALQFPGREQLAIDDFAEAILEIPRSIAANNGLFSDDAMAQLTKLHAETLLNYGLTSDGSFGVVPPELSQVKSTFIRRAFEVASLLLRIDEQVVAKEIPKFHKQ